MHRHGTALCDKWFRGLSMKRFIVLCGITRRLSVNHHALTIQISFMCRRGWIDTLSAFVHTLTARGRTSSITITALLCFSTCFAGTAMITWFLVGPCGDCCSAVRAYMSFKSISCHAESSARVLPGGMFARRSGTPSWETLLANATRVGPGAGVSIQVPVQVFAATKRLSTLRAC